jgi:hypothetical protein
MVILYFGVMRGLVPAKGVMRGLDPRIHLIS